MVESLGVLIIGAGRVSTAHARAVQQTPGAKLLAVADVDESRARDLADKFDAKPYRDYSEALKRPDIHIATIALPHFLHEKVTVDCVSAGKHVFIEKPMADTVEECDRMIAAAARSGVQLFVAHTQRYFASTMRAREIVQSGTLGRPVFATDTWYKAFAIETRPPWFLDRARGGGMWLMNGAHMIDRSCWVLDGDVESVKAWIGNPFHGAAADDANIALLRLRNGLHLTVMHTGYRSRGVDKCEVEIACTGGMLKFDSYSNRLAVDRDGQYEALDVERVDPFAAEMRNLVAAIQRREQLGVTPAWGRHIVEVLLACEESSRSGREVTIRSHGIEALTAR